MIPTRDGLDELYDLTSYYFNVTETLAISSEGKVIPCPERNVDNSFTIGVPSATERRALLQSYCDQAFG